MILLDLQRCGDGLCEDANIYRQQRRAIVNLAQRHAVTYSPTAADTWANNVTRLADDVVVLDDIELLLIALQRAGHLTRPEALRLQVDYLREARP